MKEEFIRINPFKEEFIKSYFVNVKPFSTNEMYEGIKKRSRFYDDFHFLVWKNLEFKNQFEIKKWDKLELNVWFFVKSFQSDLDNLLKPFIDFLQEKLNFNDKQIFKIKCEKFVINENLWGKEWIEFVIFKI